jgi:2-keto-4-pentenoate hydratase/2-oxohepta-3-ene-1,7-dioic acid hydratase in catechol pathway
MSINLNFADHNSLMKIICIGRNYSEHAREMKTEVPTEPVFFLKPDTALLKENAFYYPDFTKDLHHELELVIRICKNGKFIEEKFASQYYQEIGLGIDFTARDIQAKCKEKGLPWEKAKAFDCSAPIGRFVDKSQFKDLHDIDFSLKIDGALRQNGNSRNMIFSFEQIIAYVSRYITLKTGDLIFTGTPEGVGPVKVGMHLEGFIGDESFLSLNIK